MGYHIEFNSTSTFRTRYSLDKQLKGSMILKDMTLEKLKSSKSVENQFTQCLMKILKIVNDYKEHIPSITTTEGNPFPYQVEYFLLLLSALNRNIETHTIINRLQYNPRQKIGVQ